jgi:hypothetical protein
MLSRETEWFVNLTEIGLGRPDPDMSFRIPQSLEEVLRKAGGFSERIPVTD